MSMRRRESDRQKPLWVPTGQIAEALEAESLTPVARVDARGHRLTSRRHLGDHNGRAAREGKE